MSAAKGIRPPNAGKGRKPGVPNKLTADVKAMILGALEDAGGQDYLTKQAQKNPTAFLGLLGRVLPKQIDAKVEGHFTGYEPLPVPVEQREPDPLARTGGPAAQRDS